MKKFLGIFAVLALLAISCGPSTKEIEDKRIADSIMEADSIALVQAQADTVCIDTIVMETVAE